RPLPRHRRRLGPPGRPGRDADGRLGDRGDGDVHALGRQRQPRRPVRRRARDGRDRRSRALHRRLAARRRPAGGRSRAEPACDALACSAYKWFGPHVSVLTGRPEALEELRPDKLAPSPDEIPDRWELGTLPFEALAGLAAAAEYVLDTGYGPVREYEETLLRR